MGLFERKRSSKEKSTAVHTGNKNTGDHSGAIVLQDNRPQTLQRKENKTGLPDQLKSGIENLSGHSMDDVKVHYNSSQPAQLNAHAFAQGTDIHLSPGQEKHLPHEAWHVVQQKQGRVKPTMQMKGKVNINDDKGLENEADVMGEKSLNISGELGSVNKISQLKKNDNSLNTSLQFSGWRFAGALGGLIAGGGAGAGIGAGIGSVVPVIGTALGAGIGLAIGGIAGAMFGWQQGKKKDNINAVIATGATRQQAIQLLAHEQDVDVLLAIINTEATHSAAGILSLYGDGFTTVEIRRMLNLQANAATIHGYYTTNGPFAIGQVMYCSSHNGFVGSIYFPNGRIRLTHGNGPQLSQHANVVRYTLTDQQKARLADWRQQPHRQGTGLHQYRDCQDYINRRLHIHNQAAIGQAGSLVEVIPGRTTWWHPSRGAPAAFNYNLQQGDLNLLQNLIATGINNAQLINWKNAVTALSRIPMNPNP